jgi:hypothetical protein
MVDLGDGGSIGRYDGVGFTILGPLRRIHRQRRSVGAQRGGAPPCLFPARSHQIK